MKINDIVLLFVILLVMVMQYLHLKDDLGHFWDCLKKKNFKVFFKI